MEGQKAKLCADELVELAFEFKVTEAIREKFGIKFVVLDQVLRL